MTFIIQILRGISAVKSLEILLGTTRQVKNKNKNKNNIN
jgi:hypothetical protein